MNVEQKKRGWIKIARTIFILSLSARDNRYAIICDVVSWECVCVGFQIEGHVLLGVVYQARFLLHYIGWYENEVSWEQGLLSTVPKGPSRMAKQLAKGIILGLWDKHNTGFPIVSFAHMLTSYTAITRPRKCFDQYALIEGFDPLVVDNWLSITHTDVHQYVRHQWALHSSPSVFPQSS